jgi:hypothetical protein
MGNAITQDARALWLMLRNDGGWWTVSQLTHHWRPTFAKEEVQHMLDALVASRFVELRAQVHLQTYCITSSCLPLPGLLLDREPTP